MIFLESIFLFGKKTFTDEINLAVLFDDGAETLLEVMLMQVTQDSEESRQNIGYTYANPI